MSSPFTLPTGKGKVRQSQLRGFSERLIQVSEQVEFKISSRGWCYQLEGLGVITKAHFERVEDLINDCRRVGLLPIDFAEEEARAFSGVEEPTSESPEHYLTGFLRSALKAEEYYTPDWWRGERYYIQMIVEKIDLKTLFAPVCEQFHIPIATTRGWSSMLQRAQYARRFRQAEDKGLQCVLLYCGDFDPDGLRISEHLRKNLDDLKEITWTEGVQGYDPATLTIDRFGLNHDFIMRYHLTWIDNLITGSGKDLASPSHPSHNQPYVQDYLKKYGVRKCEANALVVRPREAEAMCRHAIERYLGRDASARFESKREKIRRIMKRFKQRSGLLKSVNEALRLVEEHEKTGRQR
jgi:hypothetical protein